VFTRQGAVQCGGARRAGACVRVRASCVMSRRPVDDDETMSIDHLRVISAVCVSQ